MDLTEIRNRVMRVTGHRDVDDIDSEINMVQRQYIQPIAKVTKEVVYTTVDANETVDVKGSIADDLYVINFIRDITAREAGTPVPLLGDSTDSRFGARYHNGELEFVGIPAVRKLLISYYKLLKDLDERDAIVPEIPEQWHDLYWMGAAAMLSPERFFSLFQDRLLEFKRERTKQTRPHGARMTVRGWW